MICIRCIRKLSREQLENEPSTCPLSVPMFPTLCSPLNPYRTECSKLFMRMACNAVRLQLSEGAAVWCNFGNGQPPTAAPKVGSTVTMYLMCEVMLTPIMSGHGQVKVR